MFTRLCRIAGRLIADFLQKPSGRYVAFAVIPLDRLRKHLRPGDVLLVEGDLRISVAIKYLTRSTWSHAAFYVGPGHGQGELIEADLREGVRYVPLHEYEHFNTRICRPVGLTDQDREDLVNYMIESVGKKYDLKNVFDLLRYLLPEPPVPVRWRRRMLALGSGDPTRAICSTVIAQAFQSIRYPILPIAGPDRSKADESEILHIRHHSLFAPSDFDLSPYFRIVKPTLGADFDYTRLNWAEDSRKSPRCRASGAKTD